MINGEPDLNWVKFTYPVQHDPVAGGHGLRRPDRPGYRSGLQLVGPQHADLVVLRSAAALEAALGFDSVAPDTANA